MFALTAEMVVVVSLLQIASEDSNGLCPQIT